MGPFGPLVPFLSLQVPHFLCYYNRSLAIYSTQFKVCGKKNNSGSNIGFLKSIINRWRFIGGSIQGVPLKSNTFEYHYIKNIAL